MMEGSTITIPMKRYVELTDAENFLSALEQAGVDNWSGYEEAQTILENIKKEAI